MEIIKKFNLPNFIKGKSFSEASALIAKKFEGRTSPEDIDTLNDLQGRLQKAQEYVKAKQEAMNKPQEQYPEQAKMNPGDAMPQAGNPMQEQGSTIPAGAGIGAEPSGYDPASLGNMFVDGGTLTDPLIAEGEDLLKRMNQGVLSKGSRPYAESTTGDLQPAGATSLQTRNNPYIVSNSQDNKQGLTALTNSLGFNTDMNPSQNKGVQDAMASEQTKAYGAGDSKFNPGELLRYAPAAMNAAQLLTLKKPEPVAFDKLGNTYNKQFVDERGIQNQVQESVLNNRDALLGSAGGSGSGARANLLASQLQGGKAQSQAYQAATAENRQENRAADEFKLGVDTQNLGQSNLQTQTNLQLKAGYESNKSKLLSQLGNDLGGIGQEELFKKYPELMGLSYGSKGQHLGSEKRKKDAKKASRNA